MPSHSSKTNDESTFHLWEATPALSAVVRDSMLFRTLIHKLNCSNSVGMASHVDHSDHLPGTKKQRSMSVSEPERKSSISPMPSQRAIHVSAEKKPKFNEPVVAATILYSAFQYIDHWPAPLVKAYAADCFGPRLWVDDPLCQALVENLKMVHCSTESESLPSESELEAAAIVAAAYRSGSMVNGTGNSKEIGTQQGLVLEPPKKLKRQLSSTSFGSLSDISVQSKKTKTSNHVVDAPDGVPQLLNTTSDTSSGKRKIEDCSSDYDESPSKLSVHDVDHHSVAVDENSARTDGTGHGDEENGYRYPLHQLRLRTSTTRNRYIGENNDAARNAVVLSLIQRLEAKSKQNSGLLQCIPQFATIPGVRHHVSKKLEKWLQSPGLAGLARNLLSVVVDSLEIVDPPLKEDLDTISNIIALKLKANQVRQVFLCPDCPLSHSRKFNALLTNTKNIAAKLHFQSVARVMYSYLLSSLTVEFERGNELSANEMRMLVSIHKEFPASLSYEAIANFSMSYLAESSGARGDRHIVMSRLRRILVHMEQELKNSFDGHLLLEALLSIGVKTSARSASDEEDKARLLFLSITLAVAPYIDTGSGVVPESDVPVVREILVESRKAILTWCICEFGPYFNSKSNKKARDSKANDDELLESLSQQRFESTFAAGAEPDPPWLDTMLCLLFVESADSARMKSFLFPTEITKEDEREWVRELPRVRACCRHGGIVNDDILRIVFRSTSLPRSMEPGTALLLLERVLLASRSGSEAPRISIIDPDNVWELYRLAQFRFSPKNQTTTEPLPR